MDIRTSPVSLSASFTQMDSVALVLGSPRGRRFCANVGYACRAGARTSGGHWPQTPEDALQVLGAVDIRAIGEMSELEILHCLAYAVDCARYWQPPDEEDLIFVRPEVIAALRPIAQALLDSSHTAWWAEPADLLNQNLVEKRNPIYGWSDLPLRIYRTEDGLEQWRAEALDNERRFLEYQIEDPDRHIGGEWWSIPFANGTTETTRARDGIGALGVFLEEDSSSNEARVQPVRIYGAPRIYEITGPQDWANLVDTYPLPVPASRRSVWYDTTGEYRDWFIPDWVSVAADYDAVHLTMMAYLTTPGVAIPLSANAGATVLAGWNPDATFWLRSNNITVDDDPTG